MDAECGRMLRQSLELWRTIQRNIKAEILGHASTMVYLGKRKLLGLLLETLQFPSSKQNKETKTKKIINQKTLKLYYLFPKYQWCIDIRCMPNLTITVYFRIINLWTYLFLPEHLATVFIFLVCDFSVKEWQCILDYIFIFLFFFVALKSYICCYSFNGDSSPVFILTLLLKNGVFTEYCDWVLA